ncbi:hypothetical protein ABEY51_09460 [Priestia megaterium]
MRTLTEVVVLLTLLGTYIGISLLVYKRKRTNPFFYSIYFYLATSVILICLVIFWLQLRFGLTDKQVGGLLISVVAFFLLIYGLLKTKRQVADAICFYLYSCYIFLSIVVSIEWISSYTKDNSFLLQVS